MLVTLALENYRSLRNLTVGLESLNVVTGANGTGKSSLYRALRLLADASRNDAVAALAREGGLSSTLWAGPENIGRSVRSGEHPVQGTVRKRPVALRLGFAGDTFGYAIDLGLPAPSPTAFTLDPEIKVESVWSGPVLRPAAVLTERRGKHVRIRNADGGWSTVQADLQPFDSMLSELADPQRAPELLALREEIRSWRFYDHFRTDAAAPARVTQIGTRTPVLSDDGADLAAALQTIREIGDSDALDEAIDHAFPGSSVDPSTRTAGSTCSSTSTDCCARWAARRCPTADLQPALAGLITTAATRTQLVVVSHSAPLITAIDTAAQERDISWQAIELTKEFGETHVKGPNRLHGSAWQWPRR